MTQKDGRVAVGHKVARVVLLNQHPLRPTQAHQLHLRRRRRRAGLEPNDNHTTGRRVCHRWQPVLHFAAHRSLDRRRWRGLSAAAREFASDKHAGRWPTHRVSNQARAAASGSCGTELLASAASEQRAPSPPSPPTAAPEPPPAGDAAATQAQAEGQPSHRTCTKAARSRDRAKQTQTNSAAQSSTDISGPSQQPGLHAKHTPNSRSRGCSQIGPSRGVANDGDSLASRHVIGSAAAGTSRRIQNPPRVAPPRGRCFCIRGRRSGSGAAPSRVRARGAALFEETVRTWQRGVYCRVVFRRRRARHSVTHWRTSVFSSPSSLSLLP